MTKIQQNGKTEYYTYRDKLTATHMADAAKLHKEPPLVKLAVRASAVAMDRWGVQLERGELTYENYDGVLEDAVVDTLRYYSNEGSHVNGITELVFEGQPISSSNLFTAAKEITNAIEKGCKINRNEPGGLIKEVDHVNKTNNVKQ